MKILPKNKKIKLHIIQILYIKNPRETSIPLINMINITVIAILSKFLVAKSSTNFKIIEFRSKFKKEISKNEENKYIPQINDEIGCFLIHFMYLFRKLSIILY